MGRVQRRRRVPLLRKTVWIGDQEEWDLISIEELRQCYEWRDSPDEYADYGTGICYQPRRRDNRSYGNWRLPEGKIPWTVAELMEQLKSVPYPDIIRPPKLLGVQSGFSFNLSRHSSYPPPPGRIFRNAKPAIEALVREYIDPPPCEGAVGYDLRYYESSYMVKSLSILPRRRYPHMGCYYLGPNKSWMDGKHCVKFLVALKEPLFDYQRLYDLPRRLRPPSKPIKLSIGCRRRMRRTPRVSRGIRPRVTIIVERQPNGRLPWEADCEDDVDPRATASFCQQFVPCDLDDFDLVAGFSSRSSSPEIVERLAEVDLVELQEYLGEEEQGVVELEEQVVEELEEQEEQEQEEELEEEEELEPWLIRSDSDLAIKKARTKRRN
ncbi:hypothetical protein KR009_002255 [Drosophila setifemur]|nr:hypothetical protein KR009_002255 [Drosophila setifemur]